MGNHVTSKIVGIWDIVLLSDTGNKLELNEVSHVPEMRLNLISTSKLDDASFISHFGTGSGIAKGNLINVRGSKEDPFTLCKEDFFLEKQILLTNSKDIWHVQLGHMSEKALQMLAKNHLPNINGQILESCTDCIYGKQCRVSFQRSGDPLRRQVVLELVHTDVCAPSEKSLGGTYYFVTFIDDHSRRV